MSPKPSRVTRAPRCLDLFSGIGGLSLGMQRAGIDVIGGIDSWEDAAATFERNHAPLRCLRSDLTKTTVDDIETFFGVDVKGIDIISGGPPCQGFSTIGKRRTADPRNKLWKHFLLLVSQIRPSYILIENVEGLVVMEQGGIQEGIIEAFDRIGYELRSRVLRACDYGVPQLRKRVIFLGALKGLTPVDFPVPIGTPHVTVADAIFDLPSLRSGESRDTYDQPASTTYQRARRGRCKVLRNHEAANHPPHLVKLLSYIPDGGNRKSIPDRFQPKSGFHNSYARLASDKPAIAVTSNMRKPSSARACHPTQNRGLSVREGLRLQSFDDSFVVVGSRTSQYLQVGNAVPPLLAEQLGQALISAHNANRCRPGQNPNPELLRSMF